MQHWNSRRKCTARRGSSYLRKRSKAFPLGSELFRAGDFHAFLAKDFFHATKEVRHLNGDSRLWGQKTGYDALALGNLDLVTVAEEIFHNRKVVTEVTNGGFLHVIHFSITIHSRQVQFLRFCCPLKGFGVPTSASERPNDLELTGCAGNKRTCGASVESRVTNARNISPIPTYL
jgi:hypothetical protein